MTKSVKSDITIIGAGPAGITTAMFLAKSGIKATVFDKAVFPRDKTCGDALSGKVVGVLQRLDQQLVAELNGSSFRIGSHGVIFTTPNSTALRLPYFSKESASTNFAPGHIAKRLDFDNFLVHQAVGKFGVEVIQGVGLTQFDKVNGNWVGRDSSAECEVHSKLLIIADGAHSTFAKRQAGFIVEKKHYAAGVRAYYSGISGLDEQGFIELHFLKELLPGYFWIFPLPDGMANVGLTVPSSMAGRFSLKQELSRIVSSHPLFAPRFADARRTGDIAGYGLPLGSRRRTLSGDGYLLTGDAASLIDPFTGEGIGNAMISGMIAAEHVARCVARNDFSRAFNLNYDRLIYERLGNELKLSARLQKLAAHPVLFNWIVKKANESPALYDVFTRMFSDIEMRKLLKKPTFYFKTLLNQFR